MRGAINQVHASDKISNQTRVILLLKLLIKNVQVKRFL